MIEGKEAAAVFAESGVRLFVGVPDSLMKGFCSAIADPPLGTNHIPAPNEGAAVAIATGDYLATGRAAVVYMQNSGLGNAMNPLTSLTSKSVYGIPMVLLIGWRGQPGTTDEPQHELQGAVTRQELELLGIPTTVLSRESGPEALEFLRGAAEDALSASSPVAILVEAGTFSAPAKEQLGTAGLSRMVALEEIVGRLDADTAFVATTGYTGRELSEIRRDLEGPKRSDFLMVGSMGHAPSIALGLALASEHLSVCCLDGDGALAMHMGSVAAIGHAKPRNLVHVVLNNRVHESVGGQATVVGSADLPAMAVALGYEWAATCSDLPGLRGALGRFTNNGPGLIEIDIAPGTIPGLPRPSDFDVRKEEFMESLRVG